MSEDTTLRTLTDVEHNAILAATVAKETASLTESIESLKAEKAALEAKLDVAEAAKAAVDAEKTAADKALVDFKAELAAQAEVAAKTVSRMAEVAAAAPQMTPEALADESRITRVVAMSDEDFGAYVADLKAVSTPVAPATKEIASNLKGAEIKAPGTTTADNTKAAQFLFSSLVGKE